MPVLPLVGSMMTRSVPGCRSPLSSAAFSIARATRSLIEPDGLADSSLAQMRTPGRGLKLGSSTSGVLPIAPSIFAAVPPASSVTCSASGNRRQYRDHVALVERRLEPLQIANVFVV